MKGGEMSTCCDWVGFIGGSESEQNHDREMILEVSLEIAIWITVSLIRLEGGSKTTVICSEDGKYGLQVGIVD